MTRTARVRCVRVRLAGTMNGTWTEPAWNPLGAGWSDLAIDDTSMVVTTTDDCWSEGTAADVDEVSVAQTWFTPDCAEPVRGDDWLTPDDSTLACGTDRLAALGAAAEGGAGETTGPDSGLSIHYDPGLS